MSAWEFGLWREFYQRFGFDADRLEWATANAGAAAAQSMGSKVKAADLVPSFRRRRLSSAELIVRLSALPGAKVRKIPKQVPSGK